MSGSENESSIMHVPSTTGAAASKRQLVTSWRRRTVQPTEILDAAATIKVSSSRCETDLIPDWTASECYLAWAKDALRQPSAFGRDAAVCYAKRAACRQIDAFMVCNHMWHLGLNYPEKIEILSTAGLYVPSVVHELMIDPRNQLEHCYRLPTETDARRAVQLCEMFLKATSDEAKHNAIISIRWCLSDRHERCVAPGSEYDRIDFEISRDSSPMLLIDVTDMSQHDVIILLPKDGEVMACPLPEFDRSAATKLATMLREHSISLPYLLQRKYLRKLKEDIGL